MPTTTCLDYEELRAISPRTARKALLQILAANQGNVSATARMVGVTRRTVYKAIHKADTGNLEDASRAPKVVHNKTAPEIEAKVIELKQRAHYGSWRLKEELEVVYQIPLSAHTIRNIVRRQRDQLDAKCHKPHKKGARPFVDWYTAKPFEVVQIEVHCGPKSAVEGAD